MGTYEKNHNLVILVPQVVIHATAGMTTWGHGNPVQHAGDSRLPRPVILAQLESSTTCAATAAPNAVILAPPSRHSRDSGDDELGDAGIQYNMFGDSRLLI